MSGWKTILLSFLVLLFEYIVIVHCSHRLPGVLKSFVEDEFVCRRCGAHIVSKKDQVDLDPEDVHDFASDIKGRNIFENPDGDVFDIMTFQQANLRTTGRFVQESSFFEGYAWQVVVCPICGTQIGWKYAKLASTDSKTIQVEHEQFSVKWAIDDLNTKCLKKEYSGSTIEYCHNRYLKLFTASGQAVLLGTIPKQPMSIQRSSVKLGHLDRNYIYFDLMAGDYCEYGGSESRFTSQIRMICCDSFESSTPDTLEELQEEHLRIEIINDINKCNPSVMICNPKLCAVDDYGIPGQKTPSYVQNFPQSSQKSKKTTTTLATFYGIITERLLYEKSDETEWMKSLKIRL